MQKIPDRVFAYRSIELNGNFHVPADKSISHRAVILGALSVGETYITNLLESEDVMATVNATRMLGSSVERLNPGKWRIYGTGVGGLNEPVDIIDCGNSGTSARLLMGMMATTPICAMFTGDQSLRSRPMHRIIKPLEQFGTQFYGRSSRQLPISVYGANIPVPVIYEVPVPSAQVKSAILLAALNTPGNTTVVESVPTRDHTERMLQAAGANVSIEPENGKRIITIQGYAELEPQKITVPSDPSSAAFPITAALITKDSEITLNSVGMNPTRIGFISTMIEMGAAIDLFNERVEGGEQVADMIVKYSSLTGIEVPSERAPTMIDEYPVLAVAAAFAEGDTVMRGAKELRVKESDRIDAMVTGLRDCGVRVTEYDDGLTVHGMGINSVDGGALCNAHMDHRIAMSFLCLGLAAKNSVKVDGAASISTSFPNFIKSMEAIGAKIGT